MTTYGDLQDKVARAIQDPDYETFEAQTIKDVIQSAWQDLSRIAPQRFTEDLTPIADTLTYQLRADDFPTPQDNIELVRVEIWDTDVTPNIALRWVPPRGAHPGGLTYSQGGWEVWGGILRIPNNYVSGIDVDTQSIRVWGYAPWVAPVEDEDTIAINAELEEALVIACNVGLLRRLTSNRALFTSWQTRSNNTDVSMASLMNDLAQAQEEWRRLRREIQVAREGA